MSIGVYTYITADWRGLDFPLDLWLEYHSKIFDEVGIVKYGEFRLPYSADNIVSKVIPVPEFKDLQWGTVGRIAAEKLIHTDWKVSLDVDEFVNPIDVSHLDRNYVYPLRYYHYWGSLDWIIIDNGFPMNQYRIFSGKHEVDMFNANLIGEYASDTVIPVYHTNACRKPQALNDKWVKETEREMHTNIMVNTPRLQFLNSDVYANYKQMFPHSRLIKTNWINTPVILKENAHRFNHWHPGINTGNYKPEMVSA